MDTSNFAHGSVHLWQEKQQSNTGGFINVPHYWDSFEKRWYQDKEMTIPAHPNLLDNSVYAGPTVV